MVEAQWFSAVGHRLGDCSPLCLLMLVELVGWCCSFISGEGCCWDAELKKMRSGVCGGYGCAITHHPPLSIYLPDPPYDLCWSTLTRLFARVRTCTQSSRIREDNAAEKSNMFRTNPRRKLYCPRQEKPTNFRRVTDAIPADLKLAFGSSASVAFGRYKPSRRIGKAFMYAA